MEKTIENRFEWHRDNFIKMKTFDEKKKKKRMP